MINKKNTIKFFSTAVLVVIFIATNLLSFASFVAASENSSSGSYSYIIKLVDTNYYSNLSEVGQDIRHLFTWQTQPDFKNIYSFRSSLAVNIIKSKLAGKYIYLEAQKNMQAAGVFLNDPGYTENVQDIDKEWGIVKAGFNLAWQTTVGSKSNIIAVIDTGIDETHQDLKDINYIAGFDFINNRGLNPQTNSDDNGHGTLVTGVLGATPNNGVGIVGTNWQISIMPIKALDSTGKGDASTLAQSIVWATDMGAKIINLSVGGIGAGHDTTLSTAISYAFNKGVVIVAAAGNDLNQIGDNLDNYPVYPICDDNNSNMVIGVSATDQNDLKADFSNFGKNCIDVSAPGKRILSTISHDPVTKNSAPNAYAYASGTSLAVPFVTGLAALIKTAYPYATNIQIRDRIIAGTDKIDSLNLSQCKGASCAGYLGTGRINAVKSLSTNLLPNFNEGDLVKLTENSGVAYQISGGQKRMISTFVLNQKFLNSTFKTVSAFDLSSIPEGPFITPIDGTLVKLDSSPTVYAINNGKKMPITATVFKQRGYSFSSINTLNFDEMNSWTTGSFLSPTEGSLLKTQKNKTVYWVVGQVIHPVNYNFFTDRGLSIFPILVMPDADVAGFSLGEAYIK
jgi:subtilisin family serine protease